jgi:hypothetical protein
MRRRLAVGEDERAEARVGMEGHQRSAVHGPFERLAVAAGEVLLVEPVESQAGREMDPQGGGVRETRFELKDETPATCDGERAGTALRRTARTTRSNVIW